MGLRPSATETETETEGLVTVPSRPERRTATATIALVALLLVSGAACGGGSGGTGALASGSDSTAADTTATTSSSSVTTEPGGPPQTPLTGPVQTPPPTRPKDSYLPAGVVDQVFPPGTKAFQLLAAGSCGPLLRQIENAEAPTTTKWSDGGVPPELIHLYTAAAQACLSHWSIAQTEFQQITFPIDCGFDTSVDPPLSPNSASSFDTPAKCQAARTLVYNWTKGLLASHKANSKFVPNFPTPPKP
ncbi:MAG: hypothetical protein QOG44_2766 [Acidimicrobiaceae bacterium]|jgi:hypothetical protein|nr:hypothetical protein [Acidimicrobiaceae bacterium]